MSGKRDAAALVVVIAGPTASGKSQVALELAAALGGVVINADALQCYRDLRILTARPDAAAEAKVPHRLYGFLDAGERGTVARWREAALAEIAKVSADGSVPILVGGSGLYLHVLRHGLAPVPDIPGEVHDEAASLHRLLGGAAFRDRLAQFDPAAAARLPPGDTARLLRAWEVAVATGRPLGEWQGQAAIAAPYRFATLLMMPPRERLYAACDGRFAAMIAAGALGEVTALIARGLAPDLPAMKALGVLELSRHLAGETTLAAATEDARRSTRHYAKRQTTWFRHRLRPDLVVDEKYSESLLRRLRHFIEGFC